MVVRKENKTKSREVISRQRIRAFDNELSLQREHNKQNGGATDRMHFSNASDSRRRTLGRKQRSAFARDAVSASARSRSRTDSLFFSFLAVATRLSMNGVLPDYTSNAPIYSTQCLSRASSIRNSSSLRTRTRYHYDDSRTTALALSRSLLLQIAYSHIAHPTLPRARRAGRRPDSSCAIGSRLYQVRHDWSGWRRRCLLVSITFLRMLVWLRYVNDVSSCNIFNGYIRGSYI